METKTAELEKKKNGTSTAIANIEKNISDNILNRVMKLESENGLQFPKNYSYANALKSAWLVLQNTVDKNKVSVLKSCNKESIANSLLDMVIQGLTPAKKQCYFVAYGNHLTLMRSYMGTVAVTKRLAGINDVFANVVYKGDTFEYKIDPQTGLKEIIKHDQSFGNIDVKNITGAYAIVLRGNQPSFVEIMTIDQIKKAWAMGTGYGKSSTHTDFAEEMAKKTVINRACKMFFNTSDDSDLLIEAINRTTENEYLPETQYEEEIENEIEGNANKELLDVAVETEQPVEETKSEEVNWESPISIIAAIENIKSTDELNEFNKKNKKRLSVFDGKDKTSIDKALKEKEDEVLRGF